MIDNGKKVDKFIEAITAYAQEQSRKIHDEVVPKVSFLGSSPL